MPVMQCLPGQFFDDVRSQCISCIAVCPPNGVRDNYCMNHCPRTEEVIGPTEVPMSFNIKILVAIVIPIIALLVICISIWMKWGRRRGALTNVDPSVGIEMQQVHQLLSTGEPESSNSENIRIGGSPEENAHHKATLLVPS